MDSNPGDPRPLQFDTAIPTAAPDVTAAQGVTCAVCQQAVSNEYFDCNGQSVCDGCRTQLAQLAETPRGWGVFLKSAMFGVVAAILGAILYYAVIALTDFEIGIVAIAIGYMVGWAVRRATANRGGRRYQVLALVLTYWAVGLAYTPLVFRQATAQARQEEAQKSGTASALAPVKSPDQAPSINFPMALAMVVAFSLALPVMVVAGSLPGGLLSALIIGIGLRQAWLMTGVPTMQISGPYQIAPSPPPAV